jgi:hypothetical protein
MLETAMLRCAGYLAHRVDVKILSYRLQSQLCDGCDLRAARDGDDAFLQNPRPSTSPSTPRQ